MSYVKGFVVGSKKQSGQDIWYVKVNEPSSEYSGEKCTVITTSGDFTLAPGLEVEFILTAPEGTQNRFAHDVTPVIPRVEDERTEASVQGNSEPFSRGDHCIVVTRMGSGEVVAELIWCESREEIQAEWNREMGDAQVVAFLRLEDAFSSGPRSSLALGAVDAVLGMASVDDIRDALENLFTTLYHLHEQEN